MGYPQPGPGLGGEARNNADPYSQVLPPLVAQLGSLGIPLPNLPGPRYHFILVNNYVFRDPLFVEICLPAGRVQQGGGGVDTVTGVGLVIVLLELLPGILVGHRQWSFTSSSAVHSVPTLFHLP